MSKKPAKKSEQGKAWMSSRRDRAKKIMPEYHLIVTEGTETEPAYFRAVRDIINGKYPHRVQLDIIGEGDNTLRLFEKAKERAEQSPNGYRHVWVVFDTDDFPSVHIDRTAELCDKNSSAAIQYHAVWSNQCFELWFLLHFDYVQADLHRQVYRPKLDGHLKRMNAGTYSKSRSDMYQLLQPYLKTALANARKLDQINRGKRPSQAAPGTKVFELVEKLMPYL